MVEPDDAPWHDGMGNHTSGNYATTWPDILLNLIFRWLE